MKRHQKIHYAAPTVEVVEMKNETSILAGSNENIGGKDLAPIPNPTIEIPTL